MNKVPVSEVTKAVKANTPITEVVQGMIADALRQNAGMAYTREGLVELVLELTGTRELAGVAQFLRLISGDARELVAASKRELDLALRISFESGAVCGQLYEGRMYFWVLECVFRPP